MGSADTPGAPPARRDPADRGARSDERLAWIVVASAPGVGPVSFARLLARFGGATGVLEVARRPDALGLLVRATSGDEAGRVTLAPEGAAELIALARDPDALAARLAAGGIHALTPHDDAWPGRLRGIDLPPPVLFLRGDPAALSRDRAVAVVGTRRPTDGGRRLGSRLAGAIARAGATVVSGLALGIDGAAHAAALTVGTPTVAVVGGGHDHLYPQMHRALAARILDEGGAVVSEFAPHVAPTRAAFPRRNRIISGLADATVVVEAGARSGALTTAAWALEQGRGLFLVPGEVGAPHVAGCLAFLRAYAGEARIVAGVPELLEDLELGGAVARQPDGSDDADVTAETRVRRRLRTGPGIAARLAELAGGERLVAGALAAGDATLDAIVRRVELPPATVLGALTLLEMRGLARAAYGRYALAGDLAVAAPAPGRRVVPARLRAGLRAGLDADG